MLLAWIVPFALLGSIGAIACAALLLVFPERIRTGLVPALIGYATGTLLAAAFIGMLPAALRQAPPEPVLLAVLAGMVMFFVLEKLVLWRHCHDADCEMHRRPAPLILFGDAFHNFVDGVVIAAAFLVSVPLGIATSVAVIAHEVPQEVGEFAILLDSGYSRVRALFLNTLSAAATLPGALLGYYWLDQARGAVPYMLAMSAASFIYVASADLSPQLHRHVAPAPAARQFMLLLAGIGTIALLKLGH